MQDKVESWAIIELSVLLNWISHTLTVSVAVAAKDTNPEMRSAFSVTVFVPVQPPASAPVTV